MEDFPLSAALWRPTLVRADAEVIDGRNATGVIDCLRLAPPNKVGKLGLFVSM
jgi:hypothetical protein